MHRPAKIHEAICLEGADSRLCRDQQRHTLPGHTQLWTDREAALHGPRKPLTGNQRQKMHWEIRQQVSFWTLLLHLNTLACKKSKKRKKKHLVGTQGCPFVTKLCTIFTESIRNHAARLPYQKGLLLDFLTKKDCKTATFSQRRVSMEESTTSCTREK
jgi:hypothetical protein